jgi:predicted Zn finger-like uncharacterized protein
MIVQCSSCKAKYKFDDRKMGSLSRKKVKCPKCNAVFEVVNLNPGKDGSGKEQLTVPSPAVLSSGGIGSAVLEDTSSRDEQEDEGSKTIQVRRDSLLKGAPAEASEKDLQLPADRKLSLAVIQGANSGEIFQISRPQMVIGRGDVDITVNDVEASRAHARIDVIGTRVVLRDLNSTNGTYVNEEKVTATTLENQSEFRIGSTIFMLIMTDAE